ncbi:hypothetical protein HHK36_011933 [Tetracentron sinense]|uniref:Telomerase reverse transcriptase n=1 Tax=Tetracentron sinense TaxID=13715 RepID=A0A834ZBV3_TETSI|nr:hypothetical protein HHK36_011933 [Tetracentron sinense]
MHFVSHPERYHSLVKLLKNLIRKAHGCQHLKLLDKHCAVPSLDRSADGNVGFMFEVSHLYGKACTIKFTDIYDAIMFYVKNLLTLRPKGNGVRALANLKAPSRVPVQGSSLKDLSCGMQKQARMHWKRVKYDYFKSVNYILRDLHVVLKGVRLKHPEKLGSSVFDYNDVYRRLCPFLIGLKKGSTTMPSVFVVICDVSKAFDSVDQDKLLSVMKDVILNDEYPLKQSSQVVCTQKSLWVHYDLIFCDQNISTGTLKSTASVPSRSLHSVLINEERIRNITKEELYHSLYEHVKRNVLQLGQNFYLQEVGIAQGSVLSSLLCSFYYGHLERNVIFPFLEKTHEPAKGDLLGKQTCQNASSAKSSSKDGIISSSPKHMLLRFIDDFLFISTSKMQAASFFSRLQRGFREYNCSMNEEKFCLNFDIGHKSGLSSKRLYRGEDGIPFLRWSGLLINCYTLEIQADYTRYMNSTLSSTLTVCWQAILAENGKLRYIESIVKRFVELNMVHKGEVKAIVTTVIIDPSILGGLVVEFGQKVFDMSIKTRVRQMESSCGTPSI